MNISVYIERLIFDGLPIERSQGALVQAAVEAELARLLKGGLTSSLQSGGALPSVRADAIQLTGKSNPTQLGHEIAQALYGGLGKAK